MISCIGLGCLLMFIPQAPLFVCPLEPQLLAGGARTWSSFTQINRSTLYLVVQKTWPGDCFSSEVGIWTNASCAVVCAPVWLSRKGPRFNPSLVYTEVMQVLPGQQHLCYVFVRRCKMSTINHF
uniref:Putative secreted protein n=1 Tax=Amblyomma cajennense TaxID=34607 RepID=A0A023FCJ6_AMBCJ